MLNQSDREFVEEIKDVLNEQEIVGLLNSEGKRLIAIIEKQSEENKNLETNLFAARQRLFDYGRALEKCKEQRDHILMMYQGRKEFRDKVIHDCNLELSAILEGGDDE